MQHTLIQHCLICLVVFWFSFLIYPTTAPMLLVKQICDRSNSNMTTSINQHGLGANTKIYVETLSGKPRGMSKSTTTQSTNEYNNLLKSLTQRFKEPNSKEEKIQVPLKRDLQSKSPFDCIERQFVFIHDIFLSCVFVWICLWFLRSLSDSKDMMQLFEESLFKFLHRRLDEKIHSCLVWCNLFVFACEGGVAQGVEVHSGSALSRNTLSNHSGPHCWEDPIYGGGLMSSYLDPTRHL